MKGKLKSKANPRGGCMLCMEKIFNRQRNALYCKKHAKEIESIRNVIKCSLYYQKQKYPHIKVEVNLKFSKK